MDFFDFFRRKAPPLVRQCVADMDTMLATTRRMFGAATGFLLDNQTLELDLHEEDLVVNRKESQIRSALLQHFSIDPADEMVFSLRLMSIVQDAERIGDLAKSLDKAARLAERPRSGRHVHALQVVRDRIDAQFVRTRKAFGDGDTELARQVMEENDRIKILTTDVIQTLASSHDVTVNEAVVLAMAARMIGRVGSHLSNIASSVVMPFDKIRRSSSWDVEE